MGALVTCGYSPSSLLWALNYDDSIIPCPNSSISAPPLPFNHVALMCIAFVEVACKHQRCCYSRDKHLIILYYIGRYAPVNVSVTC